MAEYLSRTGSVIVILALIVAAVILATQFSFGRLFSVIFAGARRPSAARALDAFRAVARGAPQGAAAPRGDGEVRQEGRRRSSPRPTKKTAKIEKPPTPLPAGRARETTPTRDDRARRPPIGRAPPPVVQKKAVTRTPIAPPLPLPEPERVERRLGAYTLPPASLLDRAEGRAQDRRARADGFGAAARGEVPRVLRRRLGGADPSRARWSRRSSSSPTPA